MTTSSAGDVSGLRLELFEARKLLAEACDNLPTSKLPSSWMEAASRHVEAMKRDEDFALHASLNARDAAEIIAEVASIDPIASNPGSGDDYCFFCGEDLHEDASRHDTQCLFVRANLLSGVIVPVTMPASISRPAPTSPSTSPSTPPNGDALSLQDILGAYLHEPSRH